MSDVITRLMAMEAVTANEEAETLSAAADEIMRLSAEIMKLRKALAPFAKINPSSLFAPDGRDGEEYNVVLIGPHDIADFTGLDLSAARAALNPEPKP